MNIRTLLPILTFIGILVMGFAIKSLYDENIELENELSSTVAEFNAYKKLMKQQVEDLNKVYSERKTNKELLASSVVKYAKDSMRSDLLIKKPGLVEIKINKSLSNLMDDFSKETK